MLLLRKYLKNEGRDVVRDVKSNDLLKVVAGDIGKESEKEIFHEESLSEIDS